MSGDYNPLADVTYEEIADELRRRKLSYVFAVIDRSDPFSPPMVWTAQSDPVEALGLLEIARRRVMKWFTEVGE
jgi:hypothetical protein